MNEYSKYNYHNNHIHSDENDYVKSPYYCDKNVYRL